MFDEGRFSIPARAHWPAFSPSTWIGFDDTRIAYGPRFGASIPDDWELQEFVTLLNSLDAPRIGGVWTHWVDCTRRHGRPPTRQELDICGLAQYSRHLIIFRFDRTRRDMQSRFVGPAVVDLLGIDPTCMMARDYLDQIGAPQHEDEDGYWRRVISDMRPRTQIFNLRESDRGFITVQTLTMPLSADADDCPGALELMQRLPQRFSPFDLAG